METTFIGKPITILNQIRKRQPFLAVIPNEIDFKQASINESIVIAAPVSCSIQRIARKAKSMGLSDKTHTIHQIILSQMETGVYQSGKRIGIYSYAYSIDKNLKGD